MATVKQLEGKRQDLSSVSESSQLCKCFLLSDSILLQPGERQNVRQPFFFAILDTIIFDLGLSSSNLYLVIVSRLESTLLSLWHLSAFIKRKSPFLPFFLHCHQYLYQFVSILDNILKPTNISAGLKRKVSTAGHESLKVFPGFRLSWCRDLTLFYGDGGAIDSVKSSQTTTSQPFVKHHLFSHMSIWIMI